ncbi:Thiamine-phosphate synthase [Pseudodesulfovibrio hydrargyri]|uniref:Thiamine-phosphate synthase n=1 Tax=Pseudodesulfovibrio hydrargyri TaxID=2125990 RepID=A0A1J5N0B9_9BACT|nr:thiamine phosphate synthase [Pseudodesulfovibrio hydrargyri]OIQ51706.1 Thiamine-phosphate synthase [Pseudodesulfovibrio hydrargyri]
MNPQDLLVYLVTDRSLCLGRSLEEVVARAAEGGCTMVQLREKEADTGEFVALARALHKLLKPLSIPLLINDRVDVALAAGVEGVHVGQSDMLPEDVRRLMGPDAIVGLSVETEAELLDAQNRPVDYIGIGPVYPTQTKKDVKGSPWGPDGLRRAVELSSLPLVAIGGVQRDNVKDVAGSGVAGIAVVSAICSAPSPTEATRELVRTMKEGAR